MMDITGYSPDGTLTPATRGVSQYALISTEDFLASRPATGPCRPTIRLQCDRRSLHDTGHGKPAAPPGGGVCHPVQAACCQDIALAEDILLDLQ